jgi:hypothetical protein
MIKYTTEVHLLCINTGAKEVIVDTEENGVTEDMVLALSQISARFIYNGVKYFGEKPTVDPIARKIVYFCEGYKDA